MPAGWVAELLSAGGVILRWAENWNITGAAAISERYDPVT
jgi:hypothetical protein